MRNTFEISIKDIRKIMIRLAFKSKLVIALLVVLVGSLLFSIYCILIGNFVDEEAFHYGYSALALFVVMLLGMFLGFYLRLRRIKGKGSTIITYEYEFHDDNVLVKNQTKGNSFILNKKFIKKHCVIDDVLVVTESYVFLFPNDESIRKELGIK